MTTPRASGGGARGEDAAGHARRRPLQVVAGVIVGARGFLLTRRRARDHMGGRWEFPGGKREPGEGWRAALVRELREELGVAADVGRCLGVTRHTYPDDRGPVVLRFFRCTIVAGDPRPLAAEAMGWFAPAELACLEWPAANRPMVRELSALRTARDLPRARRRARRG